MRTLKLLFAGFFVAATFLVPVYASAANIVDPKVCQEALKNQREVPAVCKDIQTNSNPLFGKDGILTEVIQIISIIIGIAAVIIILLAGLKFITSGDNPQEVSKAREMILYAIIGLIIAAFAQIIVRFFIGQVL